MARPKLPARDIVVCLAGDHSQWFSDDVHTTCAGCGINIYHRPHMPADAIKLCPDCALRALEPPASS